MQKHRVGRMTIETEYVGGYRSTLRDKTGEVLACGESQAGWTEAVRNMGRTYQDAVERRIFHPQTSAAAA